MRRFEQTLIERIVASKANAPAAAATPAAGATANTAAVVRAKVLYEVQNPASENELSVNANDIVVIHDQSSPDWWEAELPDGRR